MNFPGIGIFAISVITLLSAPTFLHAEELQDLNGPAPAERKLEMSPSAARARAGYRDPHRGRHSGIRFNDDGSITFKNPMLLRGPKALLISYEGSDNDGVCRLFGLDGHLDDSVEREFVRGDAAQVNSNGDYSGLDSYSSNVITSISCVNRAMHFETGFTFRWQRNADRSITFFKPKAVHGDRKLNISYEGSDNDGVCRLFGMESHLEDSIEREFVRGDAAQVNSNGTYSGMDSYSSNVITSITCFNGRYHTTAIAGGTIFQRHDGR